MKKFCLISTGGTIVSVAGENGLHPSADNPALFDAISRFANSFTVDFVNLFNLDSTNLQPSHWLEMAKAVKDRMNAYDGFIITHGTDTMAYSAAALYYMLENMDKPVIFTGSQLPLGTKNSDAEDNLHLALLAAQEGFAGVYLAFGGKIIHGNAARKLYTQNLRAFQSINRPYAAELIDGTLHWTEKHNPLTAPFRFHNKLDEKVAVLKLVPGTNPELLNYLIDKGCHAIIIEGFGAGDIPNDDSLKSFLPSLSYAKEKHVKIICTTQCIYDGVQLDRYEVGQMALKAGAISGGKLTTEALLVKTMLELAKD